MKITIKERLRTTCPGWHKQPKCSDTTCLRCTPSAEYVMANRIPNSGLAKAVLLMRETNPTGNRR